MQKHLSVPVGQTSAQALICTSASTSDLRAVLAGELSQWAANCTLCNQYKLSLGFENFVPNCCWDCSRSGVPTEKLQHKVTQNHRIFLSAKASAQENLISALLSYSKGRIDLYLRGCNGDSWIFAQEVSCENFEGVSHKSDVHSYGMMILEMAGAREDAEDLRCHTAPAEADRKAARKTSFVSLWCIQKNPSDRPLISQVVEMFEGNLESLQTPPKSFMFYLKRPLNILHKSSLLWSPVLYMYYIRSGILKQKKGREKREKGKGTHHEMAKYYKTKQQFSQKTVHWKQPLRRRASFLKYVSSSSASLDLASGGHSLNGGVNSATTSGSKSASTGKGFGLHQSTKRGPKPSNNLSASLS
ncbi:hypothetical protein RJ639_023505 [Escallonia herrerae]|uniref:Uncharacterized protein n=1 Tax=Escallonia herrerae TaxID=1293975 RepID=A0AA88V120_9ASTE|nr:hypothetical protein RJ639_023505 [Escallonia herrerae]